MIRSMVCPPAITPSMFFSMMRVPRIVGLPPQIAGSTLTRSSICAPPSSGTGPHLPSFDAAYQVFQQSVLLAIRSLCAPHPALSPLGRGMSREIDPAKVYGYLLAPSHPLRQVKAAFSLPLGPSSGLRSRAHCLRHQPPP